MKKRTRSRSTRKKSLPKTSKASLPKWTFSPELFLMISDNQHTHQVSNTMCCETTPPFRMTNSKLRSSVNRDYGKYFDPRGGKNRHLSRKSMRVISGDKSQGKHFQLKSCSICVFMEAKYRK